MVVIDGTERILGRIAAYAAKQALLGEKVDIVNCEKMIITGSRGHIIGEYIHKVKRGTPRSGPFFPRTPQRIVRRTIRGMLPWDKNRGREAYKLVKCYIGVPIGFEKEKMTEVPGTHVSKLTTTKYITIAEIAKQVGSKV